MIRREEGFSIVELIITMVIFVMVMAASTQIFTSLLTQFKQQSKISETNIEGVVGLDILRRDLSHAGFGLPWAFNSWSSYAEAAADGIAQTFWVDRDLNDGPPNNPARGTDPGHPSFNPPGAFRSLNNLGIHNADSAANGGVTNAPMTSSVADVLAIKAANVATSEASNRWTYIVNVGGVVTVKGWSTGSGDNFAGGESVVFVNPLAGTTQRVLQGVSGNLFWTTMPAPGNLPAADFQPTELGSYFVAYGIAPSGTLRMPFNRVDYYVKRPATGMPGSCAPQTGILYKAVLNQSNGLHTEVPIMDCVADFQVNFWLDTDGDGMVNWPPVDDISNLTAAQLRAQLKEVRAYIVAQEGQKDWKYDFSNNNTRTSLSATEISGPASRNVTFVNLQNLVRNPGNNPPNEYKYYRWKLYTIAAKPMSLR